MTDTGGWRPRLAITLYGVGVTSMVTQIVSWIVPGSSGQDTVGELPIWLAFLAYATVGALILTRQPTNTVGWLVGAVGFFPLLQGVTGVYADRAAGWPLADAARWYTAWYFVAGVGVLPLLVLLFPDGRPASRLWRWPVLVAGAGLAAMLVRFMFGPGDCGETGCSEGTDNPLQPDALRPFVGILEAAGTVGLLLGLLAGVVSLGWRFHRARGVERHQVKWFAGAVGLDLLLVAGIFVLSAVWPHAYWLGNSLFVVVLVTPAAAVVVAVLRYRLYDIDRLISRTLSYAALTALLVGVYLALVTTTTRLLPDGSSLAVAASTLAAAALFQPLRRRVQTLVDRRFNRARYDADRTVAAFSAQLREEVDLDTVRTDLLTVVHDTVQPASVGLWLRDS